MEQAIEGKQNNNLQPRTKTTSSQHTQVFYQNKEIESFIESNWISIKDGETRIL
jgi:hypothetical protein